MMRFPNCKVCGRLRILDLDKMSKTAKRLAYCLRCYRLWNKNRARVWRDSNPKAWKAIYTRQNNKPERIVYQRGYARNRYYKPIVVGELKEVV